MRLSLTASLMLSSVLFPAVAMASSPVPATATVQPVRVSTGVTAPELATPLALSLTTGTPALASGEVGLSIVVDEKGQVHDVKVTHPLNAYWDARVVAAVANGHFRPATLDHQAIPMAVDLTVAVSK